MASSCKDLESALKRLEGAIAKQQQCCNETKKRLAGLEGRIGNLERQLNGNKSLARPQDLTAIYKRLSRLESYCESLETVMKGFAQTLKFIKGIFT